VPRRYSTFKEDVREPTAYARLGKMRSWNSQDRGVPR
jgi:hypothetical protein